MTENIAQWDFKLRELFTEKTDLEQRLNSLQDPFGMLMQVQQIHVEHVMHEGSEAQVTRQQILMQKAQDMAKKHERVVIDKFDNVAGRVAYTFGADTVPWFKCTRFVLMVYMFLTLVTLLHRQDFVNLSIVVIAFYMLIFTEEITQTLFRVLVLGIFLSLFYDGFWLYMNHADYMGELAHDGGVEKDLRLFVLYVSYASFAWRFLVAMIFWKVSVDFSIIKKHQDKPDPDIERQQYNQMRMGGLYLRHMGSR